MAFKKDYFIHKIMSLVEFTANETGKDPVTILKGFRIGRLAVVWFVLEEWPRPKTGKEE